ncbi:MAG: DNA/RNA nuclease SfsA [Deltaproteobacteria bacterium]|nr:DNA/RNA nuclease SfsA [Deltaproteobacteria bacterium]
MKFSSPLIAGKLIKRYKRFLADIQLDSGEIITAHTPNSGSMKGLLKKGNRAWLSFHDLPSRKLKYTLEILEVGKIKVGVNTHLPNLLVEEAIQAGKIKELKSYQEIQREVPYGRERSRIDLLLKDPKKGLCYVEVKNVTLIEDGVAYFPDAVSVRGQKHLKELAFVASQGHRAVLLFVLQRSDGKQLSPADAIDPTYGKLLRQVAKEGVEILAYRAKVETQAISLEKQVPVVC